MNPDLQRLQAYPFEKLAALKAGIEPARDAGEHIAFSIGEPKHLPPDFVLEALANNLESISRYPATKGLPELREAIAAWLDQRFALAGGIDPEQQVLPVNGTREALFAFAQAVIDRSADPVVVSPNPFYQIYEGASILAGAELHFLNCTADNNYLPDFSSVPASVWQRCQLVYLCSPGNPTGAVLSQQHFAELLKLADQYDFVIASDECYSEIYGDETHPPLGLLQACKALGRDDFHRCVVFHSLSKRSNLPGLRSGFVAGDAEVLRKFLLYRTYHGCAMSVPVQLASIRAWQDELHVMNNREHYRHKFSEVLRILEPVSEVRRPAAGFYLWLPTPIADTDFCQGLYREHNITVLPGSFIAREAQGHNPGANHVRIALVANTQECVTGAERLRDYLQSL